MPNPNFEELAKTFSTLAAGNDVPPLVRQVAFETASKVFSRLAKNNWAQAIGTKTRTTYDTATVTLPQLAERVAALIEDLYS